jgi:hypothetical protein
MKTQAPQTGDKTRKDKKGVEVGRKWQEIMDSIVIVDTCVQASNQSIPSS